MTPLRLLGEAVVVGLGNVVLFFVVHFLAMLFLKNQAMTNHIYIKVLLTGVLFHTIFEITGMNTWYCKNRRDE
tara:strand:- start:992 stop:1210 length:219 start_codon:yes stop_codon:yes gene_type:complete